MVIFSQSRSDVQELASLLLRFYALLFRLNVYDLLEDILDSYYLFLGDFGGEYLLNNSFFTLQAFENLSVTNTEESFSFEDTNSSLWSDIFQAYYILWARFVYFYLFCLGELGRVALAIYIVILIFFEIHATNLRFFGRHTTNFAKNQS